MSDNLRPCPFCGGEARLPTDMDGNPVNYECPDCICVNDSCPIVEYWVPVADWNTRPIEDTLTARIAELEAERRWIPVSERLPELDQDVLAIVEDCIAIGHFYEEWGGDVYFSWVEVGAMQVATHWMPLPTPPEATHDR